METNVTPIRSKPLHLLCSATLVLACNSGGTPLDPDAGRHRDDAGLDTDGGRSDSGSPDAGRLREGGQLQARSFETARGFVDCARATILWEDGTSADLPDGQVTWAVSDESVAVPLDGYDCLLGLSEGTTTVRAVLEGRESALGRVEVTADLPRLSLSPSQDGEAWLIGLGQTATFAIHGLTDIREGRAGPYFHYEITPPIAEFRGQFLHGLSPGSATVTATYEPPGLAALPVEGELRIEVVEPLPLEEVEVSEVRRSNERWWTSLSLQSHNGYGAHDVGDCLDVHVVARYCEWVDGHHRGYSALAPEGIPIETSGRAEEPPSYALSRSCFDTPGEHWIRATMEGFTDTMWRAVVDPDAGPGTLAVEPSALELTDNSGGLFYGCLDLRATYTDPAGASRDVSDSSLLHLTFDFPTAPSANEYRDDPDPRCIGLSINPEETPATGELRVRYGRAEAAPISVTYMSSGLAAGP